MPQNKKQVNLLNQSKLNPLKKTVLNNLHLLKSHRRKRNPLKPIASRMQEEYTQYLIDNAEQLGLDKSQVAAMAKDKQPILVRVVDDLSEGDTQSITSSTTGGQRMGATEQAKSDAKKIKANTLREYNVDALNTPSTIDNEFLGKVLNDIVPADERNAYMTKDGKINKDGLARAERALFARAYGDDSLMEDFGENLTEEARNMANALRNNAPAMAKLQQRIADGNAYDIGFQKSLVEAVKAIKKAAKENKPAQSIWEEQSIFEDTAYSPETIAIAQGLHDFRRSSKKLTLFIFKTLARNLQNNPKEKNLFTNTYNEAPNLSFLAKLSRTFVNEYKAPKYSRDAENQLDNQGKKAENEDEVITDYAELEKLAQDEKDNNEVGYYSKVKTDIDKAIAPQKDRLLARIVEEVQDKFLDNFTMADSQADPHVLMIDKRKNDVLQRLAQYASQFVEKPSNYKDNLKNLVPSYDLTGKSREQLVQDYNLYRDIAKEMYDYGSYVYRELCEELARSGIRQYNSRNGKYVGRRTKSDIDNIIRRTRAFDRRPQATKSITELYGRQALEKLKIPKHPHEKQSRDVSAFSFGENPLSEQALKAKAEFETPLDKLEKVSRERLHKTEQRIQDFGKRIGVPVHFVRHPDKGYRGVCIHNGGIYINLNSNVPARRIFMHEFTHWLKASGKDNNAIFTALASVIETQQGTFNEIRMNDYRRRLYGGEEMSDSQIIEEIVADAMSNSESAEQIMRAIERYNPDMNVSLWSKIKA